MVLLLVLLNMDMLLGSTGENIDLDLHVDRKNWLDPNDPFASSSSSSCTKNTLDQLALCKANLKECLKVEDDAEDYYIHDSTLKHIVRNFLHRMDVDIDKAQHVDRNVQVYIDAKSLNVLRKYLNSKGGTITVREQVREILEEMIVPQHYEEVSYLKRAYDLFVASLPLLNAVLLVPALIILSRSHFSIRSFIWIFFFISFTISVFNTFHKKYQANIAARMLRAEKSFTEKCKADNFWSTALNMVSGLFVIKGESECEQHYKDMYIDPLYEIAPLDVICEVLSSFVFTTLGVFGRHFNIFFNEFYRDSPLHFIVLKTISFFFLVIVFLFWLGGYRMRTFMATVEPVGTTHRISRTSQLTDHLFNVEIPEIQTNSRIHSPLKVGLKPVRNTVPGNRRRSLSASRVGMVNASASDW